jgi:hypothetical protein
METIDVLTSAQDAQQINSLVYMFDRPIVSVQQQQQQQQSLPTQQPTDCY